MANDIIKGKVKFIGKAVGICHYNSQYYLGFCYDVEPRLIPIILSDSDNKEEAIKILIKMKNWLTLGDDGDVISFTDKKNQEYDMAIEETLLTKRISLHCEIYPNQHINWSVTRQMLNKAIRTLKSW